MAIGVERTTISDRTGDDEITAFGAYLGIDTNLIEFSDCSNGAQIMTISNKDGTASDSKSLQRLSTALQNGAVPNSNAKTSSSVQTNHNHSMPAWEIVLITIACVVFFVMLLCAVVFIRHRRRTHQPVADPSSTIPLIGN